MTEAEKEVERQEEAAGASQRTPTIGAPEQIIADLKKELEAAKDQLASHTLSPSSDGCRVCVRPLYDPQLRGWWFDTGDRYDGE